ncbi:MAG: DsrH/TusB family sulfur metabolism protein [Promethearchaeota archaeon]
MMADIVYLFGYSLLGTNQFEQLIPLVKNQLTKDIKVSVVLLHDAVVGTSSKGTTPSALRELLDFAFQLKNMGNVTGIEPTVRLHVHVLTEDLEARGYTAENLIPRLEPISYTKLVDILDESKKIVSWM